MSSPAVPPIPSPWPGGRAATPVPGVGDFLCAMVKELRNIRESSGIPRGLTWTESTTAKDVSTAQQVLPYNANRRYLRLSRNRAEGAVIVLSLVPTGTSGQGSLDVSNGDLELTWQVHGDLVCQPIYSHGQANTTSVFILEGTLPGGR